MLVDYLLGNDMAHPELDELLNFLFTFAKQMLSKYGQFHPFGAQINSAGKLEATASYTGDEFPNPNEVITLLTDGFKQRAKQKQIRAIGICTDVKVAPTGQTEKTDAICAQLEHSNGEALDAYLPYKKVWLKRVKYGDIFACKGENIIFKPTM